MDELAATKRALAQKEEDIWQFKERLQRLETGTNKTTKKKEVTAKESLKELLTLW